MNSESSSATRSQKWSLLLQIAYRLYKGYTTSSIETKTINEFLIRAILAVVKRNSAGYRNLPTFNCQLKQMDFTYLLLKEAKYIVS